MTADPRRPGLELELLQEALERAGLGVWDYDLVTGQLHWDAWTAALYGWSDADPGDNAARFMSTVHPEDRYNVQSALEEAIATTSQFTQEFRILRPDNSTAWIEGRGQVIRDDSGCAVRMIGVAIDTTDVRSARELVGRILEHVSDGLIVLDREWCITFANAQTGRMFAREVHELIGENIWEAFPEARDSEFWDLYHRALQTQQQGQALAFSQPLERWFEIRIFPSPDGLTLYFTDVHERRAAEEERNKLVRDLELAVSRGRQLMDLTSKLAQAMQVEEVARVIIDGAREFLGAHFAGVALLSADQQSLGFVTLESLPKATQENWGRSAVDRLSPLGVTVLTGEAIYHSSRAELLAEYPGLAKTVEVPGIHSFANLALSVSGRIVGALSISWTEPRTIGPDDRAFIATMAAQCAQAVERTRLFAQQQEVAETLSRAILPEHMPTVPGLEITARYLPAGAGNQVGGDWYDVFWLPDGRMGMVVGDVGGHGLAAAAVMGQLRNALRAYAHRGYEPGAVLGMLDELLASSAPGTLATAVYGVYDPETGALEWSSAGHPPPLVLDANGQATWWDRVHGTLLGMMAGPYSASDNYLEPGATLVWFTDGLVEHRSWDLAEGLRRLQSLAENARLESVDGLCDHLISAAIPGQGREDDLCLLVARRTDP